MNIGRRRPLVNVVDPVMIQTDILNTSASLTYDNGRNSNRASLGNQSNSSRNPVRASDNSNILHIKTDRDFSISGQSNTSARSAISGSVITFQDIEYIVPTKRTPCSKAQKVVVLDGVRYAII